MKRFTSSSEPSDPKPLGKRFRKARWRDIDLSRKSDVDYVYVAARKGAFGEEDRDIRREDMDDQLKALIENFGHVSLLFAGLDRGETPVGMVMARIDDVRMEPHVVWFPWSTMRSRIEASAVYLPEMARVWCVTFPVQIYEERFFEFLERHGIVRRIGLVKGYFGEADGVIYQAE